MDVSFTDIDIAANFDMVGLAYDGAYRLLVESKDDAVAGSEIIAATYNTFSDLQNGNLSSVSSTQVNLAPFFTVGGFAYDGQYRLLLESDDDRDAGSEVLAVTYDSFDELVKGSFSSVANTQIDLAARFNMVGLAFDGAYRLLIETITDNLAGQEVFFAGFVSFDDLVTSNISGAGFTDLNIAPFLSGRGYAFEQDPIVTVSEPSVALLALGMLSLLILRRPGGNLRLSGRASAATVR